MFVPVLAAQQRLVQASPGVTVTPNPGQVTFAVGSSATTQITISSTGGFAGTLSLAAYSFPYQALNVAFNPSSVTLTSGSTATSTATVSGNSTTTPYTYQIDVDVSGPGVLTTGFFNATVAPGTATVPDFRLSASLTEIPVPPTGSTAVTISVASLAGFSGDVNLTSPIPLGTLNATRIHLNPGQIANATLTLAGNCPFASPNLRGSFEMDATSGARFHWIKPLFFYQALQPTFCFSSVPSFRIVIGTSYPDSFEFGAFDGFNGNVVMSAQSSLPTTFFPSNNITVHQGLVDSGVVQLAVTVPSNTVPGNYTIMLAGTSGSLSWTLNQTIQAIVLPYFTMAVSATTLTMPIGTSQNIYVSLTGQTGFQNHINLFPIASNKNFTFTEYPSTDVYVGHGQITPVTLLVNAVGVPPGSYVLWVQAVTYFLPTENAIQLVQITIPAPASPSPAGSIFGLSPLIFYSIIGGVAVAGAIAIVSALFLTRRRRLSKTTDSGPDRQEPVEGSASIGTQLKKMLEVDPDHWMTRDCLGSAYYLGGDYDQAIKGTLAVSALPSNSGNPALIAGLVTIYAAMGDEENARKWLRELIAIPEENVWRNSMIAVANAALE